MARATLSLGSALVLRGELFAPSKAVLAHAVGGLLPQLRKQRARTFGRETHVPQQRVSDHPGPMDAS